MDGERILTDGVNNPLPDRPRYAKHLEAGGVEVVLDGPLLSPVSLGVLTWFRYLSHLVWSR